MTRVGTRWAAGSMTMGAMLAVLIAYGIVNPPRVGALPLLRCCQECEASEVACYGACDSQSHEEGGSDSLEACYATCVEKLYFAPIGACWPHCSYCEPPVANHCYIYVSSHYSGSCLQWDWSGLFCLEYETWHELYGWEVGCA